MPPFKGNKTKVLDAFLDLGKEATLTVAWPQTVLAPEESALLARLAESLGFLGRAESWVTGSLLAEEAPDVWNVRPLGPSAGPPPDHEIVRLLAPLPPAELDAWRPREIERRVEEALADLRARVAAKGRSPEGTKMPKKRTAEIESSLPRTVTEALLVETGPLRKDGWNRPPGSRWVDYARPMQITTTAPTVAKPPDDLQRHLRVARYVVASQAPPRLTEAVAVAEKVRDALQSFSDAAPVFSGKSADGRPLDGHDHAFILCEANRRHGRVSHVTVHAPMGFDERARQALSRLVKVWGHGGHDLQVVLVGLGRPEDFGGLDVDAGQCPLLHEAQTWVSHTPFVPTRHPKATRAGRPKLDDRGLQIGSPEHDLRRLLAARGLPEPVRVERRTETVLGGRPTRWSAFRTLRTAGGGRRSTAMGFGFLVEFPESVRGPVAVGYGAHFGLGTFRPAQAESQPLMDRSDIF
jgi:CRISPR-associated protein Csb2